MTLQRLIEQALLSIEIAVITGNESLAESGADVHADGPMTVAFDVPVMCSSGELMVADSIGASRIKFEIPLKVNR